jgi:hypothetical protein
MVAAELPGANCVVGGVQGRIVQGVHVKVPLIGYNFATPTVTYTIADCTVGATTVVAGVGTGIWS